jgi:hypothetical protein
MGGMTADAASGPRFRRTIFWAVPALAALGSLALQAGGAGRPSPPPPPADVAAFEQRLAPLRTMPELRGPVGYRTDPGPKSVRTVKEFMLTQYALAPILVSEGTGHAWVVGNFHQAPPAVEEGFEVAADLHNGIVLYRRVR